MKTNLLVLGLALTLTADTVAQTTCDDWVSQGRAKLAAHDLTNANLCFSNAVLKCPDHQPANVFYAITRLLVLPSGSPIDSFLTRLGLSPTNRSPYDFWTATIATNANGYWQVPADMNAEEATALARTNILPQITAAVSNLAKVSNTNFLLSLIRSDTAVADVQLDYGDILMLQALLRASEYAEYTICSYNWDVQLAAVEALMTNETFGVEWLLADYPQLLTFATTNDLAAARRAFTNAVALYM